MPSPSPYETPKSHLIQPTADEHNIFKYKKYAVYEDGVEWPARCFKCNEKTDIKKSISLTYVNPWIYLSILITPLLTIILALIFRKKFSLELPICKSHTERRRNFVLIQWFLVITTIAGFVAGAVINSETVIAISVALILVIVISSIMGRLVFLAKLKNNKLWVSGTGKTFLNSLGDINKP